MQQDLTARAYAYLQNGRLAEAEALGTEILRHQPRHFEALHLLGIIALNTGRAEHAVDLLGKALKLNPRAAEAHNDLGIGFQALKRYKDALASFGRSIALRPGAPAVHNNRGNALRMLGRHQEALASFDKAIVMAPDYAVAYRNRGIALRELKRNEDALESYDKAIALQPGFAEAYRNRGLVLRDLNRLGEALACYDKAIALRPDHAATYGNRGVVLQDLARHDDALASYNTAVALKPDDPDENWNQGLCLLLHGEFEQGWRQYEWRKRRDAAIANRAFRQPVWLGEQEIAGKTLFLHWEQGFGDTIQFYRYAKLARQRRASVILSVQKPLQRLVQQSDPDLQVIADNQTPVEFDYHCPLMSLPLAFRTTLSTIPATPRYLHADEQLRSSWEARLSPGGKPRVGTVWSGSLVHDIHNRSMDLTTLLPLLRNDVEWVCLQKEAVNADAELLRVDERIAFFGGDLKDFSDTAALLDLMDLVITIDTGVAHLAGAMGKPVWIMLPYNADWRWLLGRSDCPWYPSVRLFRQRDIADWDELIGRVKSELQGFIVTGSSR